MMDGPSGSRIKSTLTADDILLLAELFREVDAKGWRSTTQPPPSVDALRARLNHIYGTSSDGRRWPRT